MKIHEIVLAGFGGQGILFAGKLLAYAAMLQGKEVSWLPSYGPEMRGGTANCHVIASDKPIGSPIVVQPTAIIAMNKPSLEKFEKATISDGIIIYDSSLIDTNVIRNDVKATGIPATQMAIDLGACKLGNMIMLGKLIIETQVVSLDNIKEALLKIIPSSKKDLIDLNIKALELGAQ